MFRFVNSEPGTKVIKTTTTYTSKNPVSRELVFDSPDTPSSINRSIRHQSPSAYETRTIESTSKRNVSYNDDGLYGKPRRTVSPTPVGNQHYVTETRTRTISPTPVTNTERYVTQTRTVNNEVASIPKSVNYNEVVRVENTTGPSALQEHVSLSDDILPKPKTKVTTTVRTYTYEIPDDGSNTFPERDQPKNTAMFYKTERNERSANYYQSQSPPVNPNNYSPLTIQEAPPHNTTTVYKHDLINSTSGHPQVPPGGITIYPAQNQTTIYKTETVNTTNKQYRSPTPNNYPDNQYPSHGHPHPGFQPPHPGFVQQPHEPSVVVYKQTTTNTRNIAHPRPEREPLLHPFPVDGPIITEVDGNPPKRVEDLMASFGDVRVLMFAPPRRYLDSTLSLDKWNPLHQQKGSDRREAVDPEQ